MSTGHFLGASVVVFPGSTEAETLEALACREAVSLAKDIRRVRVASDCSNVISSLVNGSMGVYAYIVKEIQDSTSDFEDLEIVHERRVSNKETHSLARGSVLLEQGRRDHHARVTLTSTLPIPILHHGARLWRHSSRPTPP
jgi:hypothetical protein